jgi:hypothetical protein
LEYLLALADSWIFFQNPRNPFMVGIIADYKGDYRSESEVNFALHAVYRNHFLELVRQPQAGGF